MTPRDRLDRLRAFPTKEEGPQLSDFQADYRVILEQVTTPESQAIMLPKQLLKEDHGPKSVPANAHPT